MAEPTTTSHELLTVDEYLELEESATIRHEYLAGEIHAMTGRLVGTTGSPVTYTPRSLAPPGMVPAGFT
jgi:Uma2 family endonuclease